MNTLEKPERDHPRLRGEKYEGQIKQQGDTGITPACAGKSKKTTLPTLPCGDHPRLRGEKPVGRGLLPCKMGSPPLARGKVAFVASAMALLGITPACAGKRGCDPTPSSYH